MAEFEDDPLAQVTLRIVERAQTMNDKLRELGFEMAKAFAISIASSAAYALARRLGWTEPPAKAEKDGEKTKAEEVA